jgi:hypothetical protein
VPQHYYQGTIGNKREKQRERESARAQNERMIAKKKEEERERKQNINKGAEEKKTILFPSFVLSFSIYRFNIF